MIFIECAERTPTHLAFGAGIAFGLALGLTVGLVPACAATLVVAVPCGILHFGLMLASEGSSNDVIISPKAFLIVALVGAVLLAALVNLAVDLPLPPWIVGPLAGYLTSVYGLTLGGLIVIVWGKRVDADGAEGPA